MRVESCAYDTGSMYGCVPVCDRPAVAVLEYDAYRGPYRAPVCAAHRGPMLGRIYPYDVRELPA